MPGWTPDELAKIEQAKQGKGVPAALLMAFLRASLRAATHIGYSPHISMAKVNYLLWESIERNQFVTAFYGILDVTNRTLSINGVPRESIDDPDTELFRNHRATLNLAYGGGPDIHRLTRSGRIARGRAAIRRDSMMEWTA